MKRYSLFYLWLSVKGAIIVLLFFILGVNYLFSSDGNKLTEFWFKTNAPMFTLKRLVKEIPNIDIYDDEGNTALMIATIAGDKELIEFLIEQGANVNLSAKSEAGNTPLHLACLKGKLDAFNILLNHHANPVALNKRKEAAIHLVVKSELDSDANNMIRRFANIGVDLNFPNKEGWSLIFTAVNENRIGILQMIQKEFSHMVNYDIKDESGKNIVAFARGIGDIVNYVKPVELPRLHAGIDINAFQKQFSFNDDFTLVQTAAIRGPYEYLKDMIDNRGANINLSDRKVGNTPLHWALFYNRPKIVELLIKNKANAKIKNKNGLFVMHCLWGIMKKNDRKNAAKFLVEGGADINAQDLQGNGFLHRSVLFSDHELVKLIAEDKFFIKRVNFNLKNNNKKTAYELAKKIGDKKIIALLKPHKTIIISKEDKQKKFTQLMIASMRGDFGSVEAILKSKNEKDQKNEINKKNDKKNTALHFALQNRHPKIAMLLIELGADVDAKNNEKNTPLHEVVNLIESKARQEVTRMLLGKGADITENKQGETVIHLAVRKNIPEFIKFLRTHLGTLVKNKKGQTPLDLAKDLAKTEKDMENMVRVLSGNVIERVG